MQARRETGFLDRSLNFRAREYRYQLFRPRREMPEGGWPLILFLHGAGERGRDGLLPTQVGLGATIRRCAARFPCLVLFPQVGVGSHWNRPDMADLAMACLEETRQEERINPERLYLTGLSMGGAGVWYLGARYPGVFAALVPVCGGVGFPAASCGDPQSAENMALYNERARVIGATPTWVFHGAEDPIVPVEFSRRMVRSLETMGHPVRCTEYSPCGHDAWELAYEQDEVWRWLFTQRLEPGSAGMIPLPPAHD
jgi:predicted peptidase